MTTNLPFRAAAPRACDASPLGFLAELEGAWTGRGFNLIAVPDKQHNAEFRLILNSTQENLQFTAMASPAPDRGSVQDDINLFGLTYIQRVNDALTFENLHIETGLWMNVPATTDPAGAPSIVRQSSVPHGNSLLAQGIGAQLTGAPTIAPVSAIPTGPGLDLKQLGYLDDYLNPQPPAGMLPGYVANMNQALVDAMAGQKIVSNVVLQVSSTPVGGIISIPFAGPNANPTQIDAIFWIETIERPDGSQFLQLQYTQTVILNFLDINWPHVSVGTLIRT